jgi:hypothetical protein
VTEFHPETTEIVEDSWLSLRTQRLMLVVAVLVVAGASLVGSTMLARADTAADPRVEADPAVGVPAADTSTVDLASLLPAATLGTPLADPDRPASTPDASGPTALDSIPFDWQRLLPGWTIESAGYHEDLLGGTSWQDQRITIWIRPEQSIGQIRHVIAHEIGHALDVTYFDESVRTRWMVQRGFRVDDAWWPESGENDYASPAGDLAETIATWVNGTEFWAGTRAEPTDADVAFVRELLSTSFTLPG